MGECELLGATNLRNFPPSFIFFSPGILPGSCKEEHGESTESSPFGTGCRRGTVATAEIHPDLPHLLSTVEEGLSLQEKVSMEFHFS